MAVPSSALVLRRLEASDGPALAAFQASFAACGEERPPGLFLPPGVHIDDALATLAQWSRGEGLSSGFVPHTTLFAFVDGAIVGNANVRHRLNDRLRSLGGHVGYSVAPPFRRKGYASAMLGEVVKVVGSILEEPTPALLLTASADNVPSQKVMLANGAERIREARHSAAGEIVYFHIPLVKP